MIIEYGKPTKNFRYKTFYIIKKNWIPSIVDGFDSCDRNTKGDGVFYMPPHQGSLYIVKYIEKLLDSGNYELSDSAQTEYAEHLKIAEETKAKIIESTKKLMESMFVKKEKTEATNPFMGQRLCVLIDEYVSKINCKNCKYYSHQLQMCAK